LNTPGSISLACTGCTLSGRVCSPALAPTPNTSLITWLGPPDDPSRSAGLDHQCDDAGAVVPDCGADQVEPAAWLGGLIVDIVVGHHAGVVHALCAHRRRNLIE